MITCMETPSQQPGNKPTMIKKPLKKKRGMGFLLNLLLLVAIIAVVAMFVRAEQDRRAARGELEKTAQQLEELKNSTQASGQQVAEEVLNKIRNHIELPTDPQPTVATITDVERLRESNEFYQKAKNGDHLIITEKRAVLYDPERDVIIDVVPVQISPAETPVEGQDEGAVDGSPAPSGSPVSPVTSPTTPAGL